MTEKDLIRAIEIDNQLENINKILDHKINDAIDDAIENDHYACLSKYEDGSGWNINLSNTGIKAVEYLYTINELLKSKKIFLEKEFQNL